MSKPRTLIIGLDGATFDLIKPWGLAGLLPSLSRLMAQGVHGPMQAWPNLNSAAAWSSMVTGYNPGQHGIYDFGSETAQRDTAWRPNIAADRRKDPFWRLLSAEGNCVGVINVPISYPADPIDGFMLAGMDAPGIHSSGFAHPADLLDQLARQGNDYLIDVPNLGVLSRRNPHEVPQSVKHMVDARAHAVLHLMKTRPWDVLMAVFVATDRMQHYFWPSPKASLGSADWAPIRSLYQRIDTFLGDALALAGKSTTVLVVSDHGFGPEQRAKLCVNSLFAHLGFLHYRKCGNKTKDRLLKHLLLYGRQVIPQQLQDPLARALPGLHLRAVSAHMFSDIDWSRTQVFASPNGREVKVNLQGRAQEGTVLPQDYHALRERVRDILLHLTDPATGSRVVEGVYRREEIYRGPYEDKGADLVIAWDERVVGDSLCCRVEGKPVIIRAPKKTGPGKEWTGMHRPHGIFIACGPYIKKGATVANVTLYDVAPTILYLQGHPIPRDMDGKVLTDIFTDGHLAHHPVKQTKPRGVTAQGAPANLDPKEALKVEERLRGLGYIE